MLAKLPVVAMAVNIPLIKVEQMPIGGIFSRDKKVAVEEPSLLKHLVDLVHEPFRVLRQRPHPIASKCLVIPFFGHQMFGMMMLMEPEVANGDRLGHEANVRLAKSAASITDWRQ